MVKAKQKKPNQPNQPNQPKAGRPKKISKYAKNMAAKKSQATVFVIIGIVILIIIGISLFVVDTINKGKNLEKKYTEQLPPYLEPLKDRIQQCLYQVAKDGFVIAGQHGGYVYPEQAGIVALQGMETSSSGIEFAPGSSIIMPYWFFMKSSNTCTECEFSSKMPIINSRDRNAVSVENQLADYIEKNIDSCLDFSEFEKRGFKIKKLEKPKIDLEITSKDAGVFMEYPFEVETDSEIAKISLFQNKVDVRFQRVFDIAREITSEWVISDYKAFEKTTINLINGYGIGNSYYDFPPISGHTEFSFNAPKIWNTRDVKSQMGEMLMQNIPFIQVQGARKFNLFISENDFSQNFYNNMVMPLSFADPKELAKVDVDFAYLDWWDTYMVINPNKGGIIMPDTMFSAFPIPLASQEYDFSYDISFPVMVMLHEEESFNGEGYNFQFAIEVNIRNNLPMNTSNAPLIGIIAPPDTLFSNLNQRVNGINVKTTNILTLEPVYDAVVSYVCGEDVLFLGSTTETNGEAVFTGKIPKCVGGVLSVFKDGYVSEPVPLSLSGEETANVEIELYPIITKKLEFKKRVVQKEIVDSGIIRIKNWFYKPNSSLDISVDEEVIIILERQSDIGDGFIRVVTFSGKDSGKQTIDLTIGEYRLEAYVIRHFGENFSRAKHIIPEKEICVDTQPFNPFGGEECNTIPELEFNSTLFLGSVVLDAGTIGYFNITKNDMQKDTFNIYAISVNLDDITEPEDLGQLNKMNEYASLYPNSVTPFFS